MLIRSQKVNSCRQSRHPTGISVRGPLSESAHNPLKTWSLSNSLILSTIEPVALVVIPCTSIIRSNSFWCNVLNALSNHGCHVCDLSLIREITIEVWVVMLRHVECTHCLLWILDGVRKHQNSISAGDNMVDNTPVMSLQALYGPEFADFPLLINVAVPSMAFP